MTSATQAAPDGAYAMTFEQAARVYGLSRTRLYSLASQGRITPKRIGGRTLVLATELRALIDNLPPAPIRVRAPAA